MNNIEPAYQADQIRTNLDKLDTLIDNINFKETTNLLEVYKSINIILRAQYTLLDKPKLRIVKE